VAGKPAADAELERLQHQSFSYFLHETNPDNGLVIDKIVQQVIEDILRRVAKAGS
jgi:hypothetical protein